MIVNQRSLQNLRLLIDLLIINCVFITAASLAQSFDILTSRNYMFILLLMLNIVWYFSSAIIRFYDESGLRYLSFQFINIAKNSFIQLMVSVVFIFIAKEDLFTRNFIVFYSIGIFFLVSMRTVLFRKFLSSLRSKGKNLRNTIIIGAGEIGNNFSKLLNDNPDFGLQFLGFVDDDNSINKSMLLGNTGELSSILTNNKIDEVIIALPAYASDKLNEVIKICNTNAVRTHIIPDYFKFISKKFQLNMMGNFPIITVRQEPLDEFQWRFIKRSFDLFFAIAILIFICSWLFPLIILLIKTSSKGPAIFVQDRIGKNNKIFKCYKFRTMYINSDKKSFVPTTKDDLRVTGIGKFLRKSNMDELPQIFNVLFGDMSFVGPRPHPIAFNNAYTELYDEIKLRHLVRPGITGWAQVHGLRGDVLDEEEQRIRTIKRIEHDIWYIENWTFSLDLQIILLTVWQMIKADTKG
ncbi:MAG: undecaprenyl-phosphate glucose phosphotransferase, partial [Ignavibacteriaceae bacterium]|nr:undecaprenyl-phosphate glucose phosphotransferase [Ignavibacteriaceae bacterium]